MTSRATRRAKSPDGREWHVSVSRIRLPSWHHSRYDPWEDDLFGFIIGAPLFWFVLPLLWVLVQLPALLVWSTMSRVRWVYANSRWPAELTLIWKTTRHDAHAVADEVAERLRRGYEDVTPAGAELVFMTPPAALRDRR